MGLLDAVGAGFEAAAPVAAQSFQANLADQIAEARAARLAELQSQTKLNEDLTTRARNKADAQTERDRVSKFADPVTSQPNGLLSAGAGLDDLESVGADENVGRDVQKHSRAATGKEMEARALQAGDVKTAGEIGKMDDKDAANATRMKIAEMQQSAAFAKMDTQYQLGVLKLDNMLAKAEASGKAPTQIQQIEYLIKNGMPRDKATDLVYHSEAKVGEYTTTQTERTDDSGVKTTVTKKEKPGTQSASPKKVIKFGDLK